jgi:hypothetical protein
MTEELLGPFVEMFDPAQVMPLVVYLCSEQNELTHDIFTVGGGRYGRIFVGTNTGWFAGKGVVPAVEEVADHLSEIRDISEYVVPGDINEELMILARLAGA